MVYVYIDISCHTSNIFQFLPEKYRLPADSLEIEEKEQKEASFRCPVEFCDTEKETKKSLLVHLLMIHYNKEMELEYRDTFRQMKVKRCPECGMALLDNYLGFIKHLAVEHEVVMKYVTDAGDTRDRRDGDADHDCTEDREADGGDKEPVADVPINESRSRSASPGPAEPQLPTTATDDASFDLRAILDSDSDLDCDQ